MVNNVTVSSLCVMRMTTYLKSFLLDCPSAPGAELTCSLIEAVENSCGVPMSDALTISSMSCEGVLVILDKLARKTPSSTPMEKPVGGFNRAYLIFPLFSVSASEAFTVSMSTKLIE